MAGTIALLLVVSSLISVVCSDIMKVKSNPNGNFAMGFEHGFISNGKYGVIVPKGDPEDKREVQIRGDGVRDSIYMEFNTHTIVYSDWNGMFMLGDQVYTDTLGTLYIFRSDHKCVKKVYNVQMGEVQVVDKDTLEKSVCESMRTKVENALTHYLTTPFKYLLPNAPLKLQKSQGFPGGDFVQGVSFGTIHCGQHAVVLPPGDAGKARKIKVTAPGISEEIKMVFDTETKVFGSWDGSFFMGDKVFSVEPRVLVIRKEDGSCVKKMYRTEGGEIVSRPQLIKIEDCFLIKSKVYAAMQQLIKPTNMFGEERKKEVKPVEGKPKQKQSQPSKGKGYVKVTTPNLLVVEKQKPKGPPPIHVTNTVVLPKSSVPTAQVVPAVSNPPVIQTTATVQPGQMVAIQHSNSPNHQHVLSVSPSEFKILQQKAQAGTLPNNLFLQPVTTVTPPSSYVLQNQVPSSTVIHTQTIPHQVQVVQAAPGQPSQVIQTVALPSSNLANSGQSIFNKQTNNANLIPSANSFLVQGIDPTQQVVVPAGYVRVGRSVTQDVQPSKVFNAQETNIAASAIKKAREGNKPTRIIGVQKSNILSPKGPNGLPLMSDLKATQITTVTIPPDNPVKEDSTVQLGSKREEPILSKVIVSPKTVTIAQPQMVVVNPPLVKEVKEPTSSLKVINKQTNNVKLGEGKVLNIQNNFVNLQSPYQLAKTYVIDPVKKILFSSDSPPSKIINIQNNTPVLNGPGEIKNIQINKANINVQNDPVLLDNASPNVLVRIARSITSPKRIVNVQDNVNSVDGPGEIKNIQKNSAVIRDSNTPIILKDDSPVVFVRTKRQIPDSVFIQKLMNQQPIKILNLQDNDNTIEGVGEVKNIQKNRGYINVDPILVHSVSPNSVVPVAMGTPPGVYANQVGEIMPKKIANVQHNDNSIDGFGDIKNIQKNRGNIKAAKSPYVVNGIPRKLFVQTVSSNPKPVFVQNVQGPPPGTILNIRVKDNVNGGLSKTTVLHKLQSVDPLSTYVMGKDSPDVLVRVGRSVTSGGPQQDVLNKQVVNVEGSTISSQPNGEPIISIHGNDVVAPVGPNGLPIPPDVQASQVTKLTIPPPKGAPKDQAPQQVFIKSNVLMKPGDAQPTSNTPLYVQQPSTMVSSGPTLLSLFSSPSMNPAVISVPTATLQPSAQAVTTVQPTTIVQNQPNIALTVEDKPPVLKIGDYIIVPAKSESDSAVHIISSGGEAPTPVLTSMASQTAPTMILPTKPQSDSTVHIISNGGQVSTPVFTTMTTQAAPTMIVQAKPQSDSTVHILSNGGQVSSPGIGATSTQTGPTVIVNTPKGSSQGHIPISLMNDLTTLKHMYKPTNMIVNIAQNTNFHKLK